MVLFKTILQDTTQSRTQGSSVIPQSISIQIQLSHYSQVAVLQDTIHCRTLGLSVIPQSISIQIRLSHYSQVAVLQDTIHCNYQSISIFQESDSGPLFFAKRGTITRTPQSKQSIIPTKVYFEFYGTGYINEHNCKFYIVIYKRSQA